MNWKSKEGRALLRRAWPAGHMRQLRAWTLEGYVCTSIEDDYAMFELTGCDSPIMVKTDGKTAGGCQDDVDEGDLLPNLDTIDHATWACMLRDLAEAAGWNCGGGGLSWGHSPMSSGRRWFLRRAESHVVRFDLDDPTLDAELALVRARILIREHNP